MMSLALARHPSPHTVRFFSSSGGNAGLACATTALALSRPATIVVPMSTQPHMVSKLRALGAEVVQTGANWAEADKYLRQNLLKGAGDTGVYVSPFDHPDIWTGAASMVDEIMAQAKQQDIPRIDAIVCNVGGGGLLAGIVEGIERFQPADWPAGVVPRILAMETEGAESLFTSVKAGKIVTLPAITSIAISLGATRVADRAFECGISEGVVCATVSDKDAVMGAVRLADEAHLLVEVACGASVAPAYNGMLRELLGEGMSDKEWREMNVVVVVCGGNHTSLEILRGYKEKYGVE